jgi:ABC-2 type transport system ATP-binding protein
MDVMTRSLSKHFGAGKVVADLTFKAESGQVTGLIGPGGAGKTTALRMLLGLIHPDAGEALIGGRRYEDLPRPRRVVGAALESAGLHPGRRGRDHLWILADVSGLPKVRAEEVLDQVELGDAAGTRIREYSPDMRLRLMVAAALLGDPEVFILDDEPADGIQPPDAAWLRQLLADLAAQGRTVIVSRRALADLAPVVSQLVVLHEGRLRFTGSFEEFRDGQDPALLEAALPRLTQTAEPTPKE